MGCGEVKSFVIGNKSGVLAAVLSIGGTAGEGLSVATGTLRLLDKPRNLVSNNIPIMS